MTSNPTPEEEGIRYAYWAVRSSLAFTTLAHSFLSETMSEEEALATATVLLREGEEKEEELEGARAFQVVAYSLASQVAQLSLQPVPSLTSEETQALAREHLTHAEEEAYLSPLWREDTGPLSLALLRSVVTGENVSLEVPPPEPEELTTEQAASLLLIMALAAVVVMGVTLEVYHADGQGHPEGEPLPPLQATHIYLQAVAMQVATYALQDDAL